VRNVRLAVVLLALALAVPLALLVSRAVQSVALEREARHRVVAERVFDEMERALSTFLQQEEARPFDGWADVEPSTPFALGYFQLAPDGALSAGERRDAPKNELLAGVVERLRENEPVHAPPAAQAAGTTVSLEKKQTAAPAAPALKDEQEASAYDALRSLNKAVAQRAERQQKTKEASSDFREEADKADTAAAKRPGADVDDAKLARATDLAPLTGRALDADRLLLSRTVVHDGRAWRQGVVLDVGRLAAYLRAQALGDETLASHATATFSITGAAAPAATGDFAYQHRFADPFDDLSARLSLRTLPSTGDASYVYLLSGGLVVAALLGLLALYRMVAVAVAFAERRSDFVAAVSHELKTPLTAIRMYGEMLRDGIVPSDAKRQEYYRHITAESERLSRLINNVLEFARLEKGTRDVALTTGAVEPVVREAVELVRPHVEAEGFTLRLETDGALPPVRFERDALLQVLFNLIDNAVKYARDGAERWVLVRTAAADGGVRLAVRDSGPGVPARHLAHVFEPFYRGERELTRRHKGTGLGLALVRGLVERMGGHVGGRNVDGGGFEVTIDFPSPRT
jgi:LPXTG-motif cell wall-anchored protein